MSMGESKKISELPELLDLENEDLLVVVDDSETDLDEKTKHVPFGLLRDTIADASIKYWGDRDTDGSWRIFVDNGSLKIEKRESGNWVTKDTLN